MVKINWISTNKFLLFVLTISFFLSCNHTTSNKKKGKLLYQTHCASCHIPPNIQDLPKHIWDKNVLPDMAARMGIRENGFSPLKNISYEEMEALVKLNVYPVKPQINPKDWATLKEYILEQAPDSLSNNYSSTNTEIELFQPIPLAIDSTLGSLFTYLKWDDQIQKLQIGNIHGDLALYDFKKNNTLKIKSFSSPVVDYFYNDSLSISTNVGKLDPSEIASGKIYLATNKKNNILPFNFHRPVHNLVVDLDNNGSLEMIVSEFGNHSGQLSLLTLNNSIYQKQTLLNQPGIIRVIAQDMNLDNKLDLVALSSQAKESVTILYQKDNLKFQAEKVIQFSPIYGSSWFELIDYNNDGFQDIVTVQGDNADKTYIHKPYHGLRIFINDGKNNFTQKYFYPMHGATRFLANDYDQDGDIDFAILSTFPNYQKEPYKSFVYLENINTKLYHFQPKITKQADLGRWFLMDHGDIDADGDIDIILSSFTYVLTPVPKKTSDYWLKNNADILVLTNKLFTNNQ